MNDENRMLGIADILSIMLLLGLITWFVYFSMKSERVLYVTDSKIGDVCISGTSYFLMYGHKNTKSLSPVYIGDHVEKCELIKITQHKERFSISWVPKVSDGIMRKAKMNKESCHKI